MAGGYGGSMHLLDVERRFLGGLERAVGKAIEPMEVPSNATINQNRLDRLRTKLTTGLQTPSTRDRKSTRLNSSH